jgi:hypothetical protein
MRLLPVALNDPVIERGHNTNVDVSGTLIEHEMSLLMGRGYMRVRRWGLARNRG